jgi:2-hydroxy-3-keto-5-methylthiopentenyl-1-phosphate phosphatase
VSAPETIVLVDFDGTITVRDVTTAIWNRYVPDWTTRILPPSEAGEISAFELIRRGYADVPALPEELLAIARAEGALRPGFEDFVALCRGRGWPLRVVSNGLRPCAWSATACCSTSARSCPRMVRPTWR